MFLIFFSVGTPREILKFFHTFDHLLGLCHLHGDDLSLSHFIGDVLGHLLGNGLSHHLADSLLGLCRLLGIALSHSHLLSARLGHLLGDCFGHLLGDRLGHHLLCDGPAHLFGDTLVSSCLLSSSSAAVLAAALRALRRSCAGPRLLLSPGWRWAWAQLGHASAPGD